MNMQNKSVPFQINKSVPLDKLGHSVFCRKYIAEHKIQEIAIEKCRSSGYGITFEDVKERFPVKKPQAQRSLKHFHAKGVLFTAEDLINQGICLIQNTSPQQYFPSCIRADIIEDFKKRRNVLVEPTGVNPSNNLSKGSLISNNLEHQKAQSFLDVLVQIPFAPLYIHKLQLMLSIDKQYYNELTQKEGRVNRAKRHEENIGRRHVTYTFSPNGRVAIYIRSSATPFKIETDNDVSSLFAFHGQVRDRLLYLSSDVRENIVPSIMEWILAQCDVNKDIQINDKLQLALPDIQLKDADRIFRLYVKSLQDKAIYRAEESLTLNQILPTALDNIRYPYRSVMKNIEDLTVAIKQINTKIDYVPKCNCKNSNSLPDNYLAGVNLQ